MFPSGSLISLCSGLSCPKCEASVTFCNAQEDTAAETLQCQCICFSASTDITQPKISTQSSREINCESFFIKWLKVSIMRAMKKPQKIIKKKTLSVVENQTN